MPLALGHLMDGDNSGPISERTSFGFAFLAKTTGGTLLSGKGALPTIFETRFENRSSRTLLAMIKYHCIAPGQTSLDFQ